MHLLKLDFNNNAELSKEDIELITPSIKSFQIGEGSEGKYLNESIHIEKTGKLEDFTQKNSSIIKNF